MNLPLRTIRCGIAAAVLVTLPACGAGAGAHLSTFHPIARPSKPITINKAALLHPKHKYYGVFTPTAPADMSSIDTITQETGKQPNLVLYFQAWNSGAASGTPNFSTKTAQNACAAGLLPMYTWESWDTSVRGTNHHNGTDVPGVLWAQKAFSPAKIAAGKYDAYIRATARLMASVRCPIALRFDQEVNGYWYPWGVGTAGMPGAPGSKARGAAYIAMWRHVYRIFQNQHVKNVLWVWSPNFQSLTHKGMPGLTASYPGNSYVDWVGIDGYYYNNPQQTFAGLFGPTIQQLRHTAPKKPWLVSETGVGTYPDDPSKKPAQITNLLHGIASRKHFNGFIYFNQYKPYDRSDWRFDADQPSLNAFKAGVHRRVFASGKPGSL